MYVDITIPNDSLDSGWITEPIAKTRDGWIDGKFCGLEKVMDQIERMFIADGETNGGGPDPGFRQCRFIEFGMSGQSRTADNSVGLAQ